MRLHELSSPAGSKRAKRRVGRGIGGHGGKTAGRGSKGQKARDQIPLGFEGGQLPLMQRIPKLRGFHNPFRVSYTPVNVDALDALEVDEVKLEDFVRRGLARPGSLVKILGRGNLSRPVRVQAHAFSKSAEVAITGAGGQVERVPRPFGDGRPPAKGNALTNR